MVAPPSWGPHRFLSLALPNRGAPTSLSSRRSRFRTVWTSSDGPITVAGAYSRSREPDKESGAPVLKPSFAPPDGTRGPERVRGPTPLNGLELAGSAFDLGLSFDGVYVCNFLCRRAPRVA